MTSNSVRNTSSSIPCVQKVTFPEADQGTVHCCSHVSSRHQGLTVGPMGGLKVSLGYFRGVLHGAWKRVRSNYRRIRFTTTVRTNSHTVQATTRRGLKLEPRIVDILH
ncbi:hypothetical protein HBH56_132970 [Parastagonospora nodorum]|uniref:Uncharacterized protein n=1 Tax=Phaeosphaeria nodorum (strain SN15 / ATCC MYA-4574 / FGSC 10173) TaxID=321614 RepID=A0A7U2FH66_PHANO|nr:hypothetical protein HBH56_132970 [Parastagonospora nodorum]QRD02771.1 hypothetical protein JI435_418620 [Parastagonospora nodorum SN15]KAH3926891.1 hypothetical protein HBH54_160260 [Parastagonospora nodorum]KAH4105039.1 hypothetical protein HBH46_089070 [Parastagonospora nodorum]KAH4144378.1 hypothetical protein HBH45_026030 [Parastagonospora nodorum]